jgi:hypothetical protein
MTPQERELLEGLFTRIRASSGGPRDPEADAFISEQVRQSPQAAYLLSQTVIVQEEALKAAAAKIDELNGQIADLEDKARSAQQQPASFLGGIGKSFLGGDSQRVVSRGSVPSAGGPRDYSNPDAGAPRTGGIGMPAAPAPGSRWTQQGRPLAAAPEAQQQAGGGSFLKGALGAAAGVAGGMLLANSLSGLFKDGNPAGGDAKAAAKGESHAAATPASDQNSQPWGPDSQQDVTSAEDDGFEEMQGWDAQDDSGGWSDEE